MGAIADKTTARIAADTRDAGIIGPDDELLGWLALLDTRQAYHERITYLLVTEREVILTSLVSGFRSSSLTHSGFPGARVLRLARPQDLRLVKPSRWAPSKVALTPEMADFLGWKPPVLSRRSECAYPAAKGYVGAPHSDEDVDKVLTLARSISGISA